MNFFVKQNRIHSLRHMELQECVQASLLEPSAYTPRWAPDPVDVPCSQPELMGTQFGLLVNEVCFAPLALAKMVCELLDQALSLNTGDPEGSTVDLVLFSVRLASRVESYAHFLVEVAHDRHPSVKKKDLHVLDRQLLTPEAVRDMVQAVNLLRTHLRRKAFTMLEDWIHVVAERIAEQEAGVAEEAGHVFVSGAGESQLNGTYVKEAQGMYVKRGASSDTCTLQLAAEGEWSFHKKGYKDNAQLYMSADLTPTPPATGWKATSGLSPPPTVEPALNRQARLACNFHAHRLLLLRHAKKVSTQVAIDVLSSFMFLVVRHTWNQKPTAIPDPEVYEIMGSLRRPLIEWMEHKDRSYQEFGGVLDTVYKLATRKPLLHFTELIWCKAQDPEDQGRFVALGMRESYQSEADVAELQGEEWAKQTASNGHVPIVDLKQLERRIIVEVNCQTFTLKMINTDGRGAIQCEVRGSYQFRQDRYVAAEGYLLHAWVPDQRLPMLNAGDVYDPEELEPSETWVADLFEPVRNSFFVNIGNPPQDVTFFFADPDQETLDKDAHVAVLVGAHLQQSRRKWKEVVLYRAYGMVQVFTMTSHGRRFHRTLEYTTNAQLTLHAMQPDTDCSQERPPFPPWGRHQAGQPDVEPQPPPHPPSVSIFRGSVGNPAQQEFVPARLMYGLLPAAILEQYNLWQSTEGGFSIRGAAADGDTSRRLEVSLVARAMAAGTAEEEHEEPEAVCARVEATFKSGDRATRYVLLNPLTAPAGTPLYSVAR
ncbi:unnamed protein product, partial [Prorocentrum cordatum]